MNVICPVCLNNVVLKERCYNCNGAGEVKSNRQKEKERKERNRLDIEKEKLEPWVTIKIHLPTFKRALSNLSDFGFISEQQIVDELKKYVVRE